MKAKRRTKQPLIHIALRFIEERLVFVLALLALITFTVSYAQAEEAAPALDAPIVADVNADLLYPTGTTKAYSCIDFTSSVATGCVSAYSVGTFDRQDIARTSEGTFTVSDTATYKYILELDTPLSATPWYVIGDAEKLTVNGRPTLEAGAVLTGATSIKIEWKKGALRMLSHDPYAGETSGEATATVGSLFVIPVVASVTVGGNLQLIATGVDQNGNPVAVSPTWSSSNLEIATINDEGIMTGIKTGPVTLTASLGNITASATITVMEPISLLVPTTTTPISLPPTTTPEGESTTDCPTGWIGTDCGTGDVLPTPSDPDAVIAPTVPSTITDTNTQTLLDDLAVALTENSDTSSVSGSIQATTNTLFSADVVANRYMLTGSVLPTAEEFMLAINAQPNFAMKVAVAISLTAKAIGATISNAFTGQTVLDQDNQVITQTPSLYDRVSNTVANLFLGGNITDTIPGRGAEASTFEELPDLE